MDDLLPRSRDLFLGCDWSYETDSEEHYGYYSISSSLDNAAKEMLSNEKMEHHKILKLLASATSMLLNPHSLNEPFRPLMQDFQNGRRTTLPEDFEPAELAFFEAILSDVNEPYLKARLADILWLVKRPKNPEHAKIAIESYISNKISSHSWHRGAKKAWERAARICLQIKEYSYLDTIKNELLSNVTSDSHENKFMSLWAAELLHDLKIDHDLIKDIAPSLAQKGEKFQEIGDYETARMYFSLASKKYKQLPDENESVRHQVSIARCFELEADSRKNESSMIANSLYGESLQAYRVVPKQYRDSFRVEGAINDIKEKITSSGQTIVDEMTVIKTSEIDISEITKESINHVSGKNSPEEALMYFTGLSSGANYKQLAADSKIIISNSISSLLGATQTSTDGRITAKIPPFDHAVGWDDPTNKIVLNSQMQKQFTIHAQIVTEGRIIPALNQLLYEHRITKELMIYICDNSPIVPKDRVNLLGYALWLGFEYQFGPAAHLLCPQFEHIVRLLLKEQNAQTSNIDINGIENENGLSTLMDLPETTKIFEENLLFEIRSVFTDSLGFNLRNLVAHGLIGDEESSSIPTAYAWWMVLRLVIRSISKQNDILLS